MGQIAAERADIVIVTDDNPRTEDPAVIRAAVLEGAHEAAGDGVIVIDGGRRREAINEALRMAEAGDVICVLGKGHETGQNIGSEVLPFDDREVIRAEWKIMARQSEEDQAR
jgi:UDP-N-acetylmuramoyl-L-alanyl-D-glutamate--2,6-diaminopimelate ligase